MFEKLKNKIFKNNLNILFQNKYRIVNTINPHSFILSLNDQIFYKSLFESDLLFPDGIGIVFAIKFLYRDKLFKISGSDLHDFYLNYASKNNLKVFYFGSSVNTTIKIKNKIKSIYPNLVIDVYSPPYKEIFTTEDDFLSISKINNFAPDILFVGMTAPKQEKWVYLHKSQINAKIICSIGAVFDFYAGNIKRPNQFWINLGLEWFIRFLKEPKRLFKRNFISTPLFLFYVLKTKLLLVIKSESNAI